MMSADRVTISLCMIAKDEEKNLERCLKSACDWVDEIIVVDTGSRDATTDIARNFGALVVPFCWKNDFSAARNESLKMATKKWVLVLDADEELPQETARNLQKLATTPGVDAWTFTIISPSFFAGSSQKVKHLSLRMFKNNKGYRFQGKIHEQIKHSILRVNPSAVIRYAGLEILHYGYTGSQQERREKTLRNIALLKEALRDDPADPFYNFNLGVSYFLLGDLENSRKHYQTALENLTPDSELTSALYRNYCICLYEMGEYSRSLKLTETGLAYFPDYPDLYFLKGQIFWELGLYSRARASFEKCTSFRKTPPKYLTTEGVTSYLALENLAEVCTQEGDFEKAVEYIRSALEQNPCSRLFSKLADLLKKSGKSGEEIAVCLETEFQLDDSVVAQLLFALGDFKGCFDYLDRKGSQTPEMLLLKGRCLLYLGDYTEAIKTLSDFPVGFPLAEEFLRHQCLAMWLQNPRKDAGTFIAAFGDSENPVVISCRMINSLIFREEIDEEGFTLEGEVREHALNLALEALELGDQDLAVLITRTVAQEADEEVYFLLGSYSLSKGKNQLAQELLRESLERGKVSAEVHYLLGKACANLGFSEKAFPFFLQAFKKAPGNQLYAASALEQLASQCLLFVLRVLNREKDDPCLLKELFKLASLRKKAQEITKHLLVVSLRTFSSGGLGEWETPE